MVAGVTVSDAARGERSERSGHDNSLKCTEGLYNAAELERTLDDLPWRPGGGFALFQCF